MTSSRHEDMSQSRGRNEQTQPQPSGALAWEHIVANTQPAAKTKEVSAIYKWKL